MNYIRHLNTFFSHVKADPRLSCTHISLYMALFQFWNYNRFEGAFPVYRANVMQLCKIGSKNTYHKCIKELHDAGYIRYHPAINRYLPVKVSMRRFDQLDDEKGDAQLDLFNTENPENQRPKTGSLQVPVLTEASTEIGPLYVPKTVHIVKQYKQVNSVHTEIFKKNERISEAINVLAGRSIPVPGKDALLVDNPSPPEETISPPPSLAEVEAFFQKNEYPLTEAKKFWYYNEGRGWMLAEDTPIYHWQSIARKWMIGTRSANGKNGKRADTQNLHTNNEKNYDEPL